MPTEVHPEKPQLARPIGCVSSFPSKAFQPPSSGPADSNLNVQIVGRKKNKNILGPSHLNHGSKLTESTPNWEGGAKN